MGSPLPYLLSGGLAVAAASGSGLSLFVPELLGGVAVGKGNLRGTALVILAVAVPLLLAAIRTPRHRRDLVLSTSSSRCPCGRSR
jgi:hypothetical protein